MNCSQPCLWAYRLAILGAQPPPGGQSGRCSSASVLVTPRTGGPLQRPEEPAEPGGSPQPGSEVLQEKSLSEAALQPAIPQHTTEHRAQVPPSREGVESENSKDAHGVRSGSENKSATALPFPSSGYTWGGRASHVELVLGVRRHLRGIGCCFRPLELRIRERLHGKEARAWGSLVVFCQKSHARLQNAHGCGRGRSRDSQPLGHRAACWAPARFQAVSRTDREGEAPERPEQQPLTVGGYVGGSWLGVAWSSTGREAQGAGPGFVCGCTSQHLAQ